MASSSSSSSSVLLECRFIRQPDQLSSSIHEDTFNISIHVFRNTNLMFRTRFSVPCERLRQRVLAGLQSSPNSQTLFYCLMSDIIHLAQTQDSAVPQRDGIGPIGDDNNDQHHRVVCFEVFVNIHRLDQQSQQPPPLRSEEKIMESLKKVNMKVNNKEEEEEAEGEQCCVCLEKFEDIEDVFAVPCQHVYHKNCIVQWLERSNSCPLCRFQIYT